MVIPIQNRKEGNKMFTKKEKKRMEQDKRKFEQTSKEIDTLTMLMLQNNEKKLQMIRQGRSW